MSFDDGDDFAYDNTIHDPENKISISVTLSTPDDDAIQFGLGSGQLRIPFFLTLGNAEALANAILSAVAEAQ